jgi:PAS domain S-box-containing protein
MADHTFQLEGNSVGDGLRVKQNIPESCKNVHSARNPKGSRSSRFFAGLSYNRLISESVEDEAGISTIMNGAEGRLNPGEDALRLILDTTPALIHTGRPDGYLDYFNRGWLVFVGKSSEELCGWRWTDSIHPQDVAGMVQKWQAALANGEPLQAEARVRRADGEYRLLLHRKVPLRDERGAIVKWFGSSIDIDDRKRAEERIWQTTQNLQRSEFYLQQGQRLTHCGSWSFLPSGECDYWSPELYKILGFDPSDGIPALSDYVKVVHPDDRSIVEKTIENMNAEGIGCDIKQRIVRTDGELRFIRCVSIPVMEKGKVVRFVGTLMDITEQERLTQELRLSEFYLQEGERLARMGSWSLKPDGTIDYWSPQTFVNCGFDSSKGVPTLTESLNAVHPDDRDFIMKTLAKMTQEGVGCDVRHRIIHPEHGVRIMHSVGEAVIEDGRLARFIGNTLDITEQEELTLELRRREACLTQAEALSRTGSFGWNVSTGDFYWSDETFRILEYERTVKPTLELLFKRFHPEDAATVQETIERALKDAKNLDFEHRVLMPNGSIKHVHVLAQPFKDRSGNVEFVGAVMDVTATKKAFEEIKALKDELYKENIVLREEVDKTSMFEEVVGTSPALQAVLARAAKVAPTDSTVLILGETGTGKELIARAIHKRSQRSARAFVSVNCAAIPPSLITSELFGHEKGAFTGATQRRLGRFELAEGGTLFLDEIGELPVETQIALLRVLQEREFERVGGTEPLRADVRVIAATNRDLQGAITAGTFRSDLFYRLDVFPITLPPLRERKEDIPPLVSYFVDRYAKRAGRKIRGIRKSALDSLQSYSWPGNIRELQNVIERSLIVCETDEFTIDQSWLSGGPVPTGSADQALIETSAPGERELIEAALAQTKGKVSGLSGAAAKLGIPASTLESKIRSLKINKYRFKEH